MLSSEFSKKTVDRIFKVIPGDIVNLKDEGKSIEVDAIVNAAKPTLMGGSGVDGAIHSKMNSFLKKETAEKEGTETQTKTFKDQIKEDLGESADAPDEKIRCNPGDAVITRGNKEWAKYIIHAVGSKYDGGSECMRLLQKCYENIMKCVFEHGDICSVAIPVISSGNYNCPFDLALQIAISTIGNCLIREKRQNYDNFARMEKVYLVIFEQKYNSETKKIYERFSKQIEKEQLMVYCGPARKQAAYCVEILKNDSAKRGYFTVTKMFRLFLAASRFLFPLSMIFQKILGKYGWQDSWKWVLGWSCGISAYFMIDTILCLLSLIFLTDLYSPSANRMRTLIFLIFNYAEMLFGIALFYYSYHWKYWKSFSFLNALDYSILGKEYLGEGQMTVLLRLIMYSREGIEFFFIVLTFTFFVSQLKRREFAA